MVYNISYSAVKILRPKEVGQTMNEDIPAKFPDARSGWERPRRISASSSARLYVCSALSVNAD
jgi:hypothetical protein